MRHQNKLTIPTLLAAQLIHELPEAVIPADTLRRLDETFAKLRQLDPCPRMHATYAADAARIRELLDRDIHGETREDRSAARAALRMLGDDYRALALCDPKDDAEQDQLLAMVIDRAYQQHQNLRSYGPAL